MSEIRNAGWQNAQEKEKSSMDKIEKYIDELLEKSTPDRPIWNIEKILQALHWQRKNFAFTLKHRG